MVLVLGSPPGDQELVLVFDYMCQDIGTCPCTAQSSAPDGTEHRGCSSLDTWDHNLAEGSFGGGNLEGCGWE